MNIAILSSWGLVKANGKVYIPSTHYVYLKYICTIYSKIYLICPVWNEENKTKIEKRDIQPTEMIKSCSVINFDNVIIKPLPFYGGYLKALKYYKYYYNTISQIVEYVDCFYCRVPDPFSWMPTLIFKKKSIMHFVGDAIDATLHNEKWSWLKKKIMILGYLPDYWLTIMASKKSKVYTNGYHLANKLKKFGINPIPVISSTVFECDLIKDFQPLPVNKNLLEITYIGYIRFAKGMKCLLNFCKTLKNENVNFHFHLIGKGEMYDEVNEYICKEQLSDYVIMHGYLDSREEINKILRNSDLFFFPSLSEGSPRVVIEAMAQGTPVLSTPVGSLPTTFKDKESIRFFNFNDVDTAVNIVKEYLNNPNIFETQRKNAFKIVSEQFTIEKFLSRIFIHD